MKYVILCTVFFSYGAFAYHSGAHTNQPIKEPALTAADVRGPASETEKKDLKLKK